MDREATATSRRPDRDRRSGGFTLVEAMIVVGIIGIIAATAVPNVSRYMEAGRGRAAAKSVADAFTIARAQAIRTGSNQVVFFGINGAGDVAGNALQHDGGQLVPILVLNDGAPGSADQNCEIDDGEEIITFDAQEGVGWGRNKPGIGDEAPDDWRLIIPALGSSFRSSTANTPQTWVQFRPDGVPVAIDAACTEGRLGTGSGTIYLWTENRDFAITLSPLGGVRVHTWNDAEGEWTL